MLLASTVPAASEARNRLASAGAVVAQRASAADAERERQATIRATREQLTREAILDFRSIKTRLFDEIAQAADGVHREKNSVVFGSAHLIIQEASSVDIPATQDLDVLAFAPVQLHCAHEPGQYGMQHKYTFRTVFVFGKFSSTDEYRWREVSFRTQFSSNSMREEPTPLNPNDHGFALAFSRIMGPYAIAYGPWEIDAESEDSFIERWLNFFAKAVEGRLFAPDRLPLPGHFFR